MRSVCVGALVAALLATNAIAQQKANDTSKKADKPAPRNPLGITPRAVSETPTLAREFKARYVMRMLDLTPDQKEQYLSLVQSVMLAPPKPINLAEVRQLYQEMQKAKRVRDTKKYDELREKINEIGRAQTNEPDFFDNVRLMLTDAQKKTLDRVLARLDRIPSGGVRPVDVFDYLDTMKLSDAQRAKLREVREAFRKRSTTTARTDAERRSQLLGRLLAEILDVLDDAQDKELTAYIDKLRPDTLPNIEVMDQAARRALESRGRKPKTGG